MHDDKTLISKREVLDAFGRKLAEKRQNAIDARKNAGHDARWSEDAEYKDGIDEVNRPSSSVMSKEAYEAANGHMGVNGRGSVQSGRSTVFINMIQPYCSNISAALYDMLMPVDDVPFAIEPTPIPLLSSAADDVKSSETVEVNGAQIPVAAIAKKILDDDAEAKAAAEKAQTIIEDQLTECDFNRELRGAIDDLVELGSCILKGPYAKKKRVKKVTRNGDEIQFEVVNETVPAAKRINLRNLFADPNCGENIQNGAFVFEKDDITMRELQALKGMKGSVAGKTFYLDDQIDRCIKEGPGGIHERVGSEPSLKDKFELWIYYGTATADDMNAADVECEKSSIDVMVVMVNNHVIKAQISPFDSGAFPYHVMPYQRITGSIYGIGVARQGRDTQAMINAIVRNLLDNAGKAGRPLIVIADGVESEDGYAIEVGQTELLRIQPGAMVKTANEAISTVVIPMITPELLKLFELSQKLFEDVTGTPMLLQGQQGSAPDTVGGMQQLEANASATRRKVATNFDDALITPLIQLFYEWHLLHGHDNGSKGDFTIKARGSRILFERDAANRALSQFIPLTSNPETELDIRRIVTQLCKANRIDPNSIKFTKEEVEQRKAAMAQNPPPKPPALAAAEIRAQSTLQTAQINQKSDMEELELKAASMRKEFEFKESEAQKQREHDLQIAQMNFNMKVMELAQARDLSISDIKKELAINTQRLTVQADLSKTDSQVSPPPTEPAGRAKAGHAYEQ